jgi:PTH2 family peptidyl-tRNA hydrolase
MKQVIVVRKDLKLSKGKMSAQVSHASLDAYGIAKKKCPKKVREWEQGGAKKVVLYAQDKTHLLGLYESIPRSIPKKLIMDAGHTHLDPGTLTCFGVGPYDDEELDRYTGDLKLVN